MLSYTRAGRLPRVERTHRREVNMCRVLPRLTEVGVWHLKGMGGFKQSEDDAVQEWDAEANEVSMP